MSAKLSLVLSLLTMLAPAGAAAYSIQRSYSQEKGRVVTYYNTVGEHDWAVKRAARAWNRSGAEVEFVPASKDEAELVIEGGSQGLSGHASSTLRSSGPQPGDSKITIPSPSGERDQRFSVALIAAHELGHVVGLNHEDSGCATMNSTITAAAPKGCEQPPAGQWRCGLLEEDDIEGAVELHGGTPRPPRRAYCPKVPPKPKPPPPPPPQAPDPLSSADAVEVLSDAASSSRVTVRWLNGASERVRKAVVARAPGRCPAKPDGLERRTVPADPGGEGRATFPLDLVPSCYAVWSRDRSGRLSREPATAHYDPPATPQPPTNLVASLALSHPLGDTGVSLRWHNAEADTVRSVLIARAKGRCPSRPPRRPRPWEAPAAQPDAFQEHYDLGFYPGPDAARYCYALWSRDRFGRLSRPATAWPRPAEQEDDELIILAG
ncbi:MAG: matrixin family metalloprotease [Thermoleophilaceae bacterium]|nr:matrixin family metalloprotease [Thermoleophilaceae bacterium]